MSRITVAHGASRELVVVLLAVERLLHAAVVALALLVTLAILERYAVIVLHPIVAVIGIQVSLIETELGQQHGIARKLVVIVEQCHRRRVHHEEKIEVIGLVRQGYTSRLRGAEIIGPLAECVPHHAVTLRRPIERRGRCHSAVGPAVLVLDSDDLALMRETNVLHAAAVEVLMRLLLQRYRDTLVAEIDSGGLLDYGTPALLVRHGHQARRLVKRHLNARRRYDDAPAVGLHIEPRHLAARIIHEYPRLGRGLRIADDASRIVLEKTEDVVAVKIERHAFIAEDHIHRRGVDLHGRDFGRLRPHRHRYSHNAYHAGKHRRKTAEQGRRG